MIDREQLIRESKSFSSTIRKAAKESLAELDATLQSKRTFYIQTQRFRQGEVFSDFGSAMAYVSKYILSHMNCEIIIDVKGDE